VLALLGSKSSHKTLSEIGVSTRGRGVRGCGGAWWVGGCACACAYFTPLDGSPAKPPRVVSVCVLPIIVSIVVSGLCSEQIQIRFIAKWRVELDDQRVKWLCGTERDHRAATDTNPVHQLVASRSLQQLRNHLTFDHWSQWSVLQPRCLEMVPAEQNDSPFEVYPKHKFGTKSFVISRVRASTLQL
jgi:hypothetical protein